jgi:hypothetical protein
MWPINYNKSKTLQIIDGIHGAIDGLFIKITNNIWNMWNN